MKDEIITNSQEIYNTMEQEFILDDYIDIPKKPKKRDREKEIKRLLYLKSELIKQTKKEIKCLHYELDTIYGTKRLGKKCK